MTSNISEAIDFEEMEVAKLQLQAEYWKLTSLRYADYQYTLIYDDFSFNQASDRVTVSLRDKSEVIREDSIDQNSKEPNVTGREFGHLFTLHKEEAESE
ncbi:MAG: hypothetical protein U5K99_07520 [Anaerolineales bacterium]|nr:hypothetical protein [Anaerolineales bacterium]